MNSSISAACSAALVVVAAIITGKAMVEPSAPLVMMAVGAWYLGWFMWPETIAAESVDGRNLELEMPQEPSIVT